MGQPVHIFSVKDGVHPGPVASPSQPSEDNEHDEDAQVMVHNDKVKVVLFQL